MEPNADFEKDHSAELDRLQKVVEEMENLAMKQREVKNSRDVPDVAVAVDLPSVIHCARRGKSGIGQGRGHGSPTAPRIVGASAGAVGRTSHPAVQRLHA